MLPKDGILFCLLFLSYSFTVQPILNAVCSTVLTSNAGLRNIKTYDQTSGNYPVRRLIWKCVYLICMKYFTIFLRS